MGSILGSFPYFSKLPNVLKENDYSSQDLEKTRVCESGLLIV